MINSRFSSLSYELCHANWILQVIYTGSGLGAMCNLPRRHLNEPPTVWSLTECFTLTTRGNFLSKQREKSREMTSHQGPGAQSPSCLICHTIPMFPVGLQTCCQPAMQQCLQVIALPHEASLTFSFAMKARWYHYRWFSTSVCTCCCAHSQWRVKRGVPPLLSSTRKQKEKHICWWLFPTCLSAFLDCLGKFMQIWQTSGFRWMGTF